jgi:hypothetical protein
MGRRWGAVLAENSRDVITLVLFQNFGIFLVKRSRPVREGHKPNHYVYRVVGSGARLRRDLTAPAAKW